MTIAENRGREGMRRDPCASGLPRSAPEVDASRVRANFAQKRVREVVFSRDISRTIMQAPCVALRMSEGLVHGPGKNSKWLGSHGHVHLGLLCALAESRICITNKVRFL